MTPKVAAATKATAEVQEYVDRARELLAGHDARMNAIGVLMKPHDYRRALLAAVSQLNAAAVLIERSAWPSEGDYREAGL